MTCAFDLAIVLKKMGEHRMSSPYRRVSVCMLSASIRKYGDVFCPHDYEIVLTQH
jgi:hypothetical protein